MLVTAPIGCHSNTICVFVHTFSCMLLKAQSWLNYIKWPIRLPFEIETDLLSSKSFFFVFQKERSALLEAKTSFGRCYGNGMIITVSR